MMRKSRIRMSAYVLLITALIFSFFAAPSPARSPRENPDFTQGGKTDGSHDWTLGPTGARGWMHAWKHTADARQNPDHRGGQALTRGRCPPSRRRDSRRRQEAVQ